MQLYVSSVFQRMTNDAPRHLFVCGSAGYQVRELLILIPEFGALQLAVFGRPFQALREVTPVVGAGHRTLDFVRTGRQNVHAGTE